MKKNDKESRLLRLKKNIVGHKNAIILIYRNPDPDSLSSAWALKEIMKGFGVAANIVYTGEVGRFENEAMIKYLRIPAVPYKEEDLETADLVALVDSQPDFFSSIKLPRCDIIIDHHPAHISEPVAFVDIRPNRLAAASIMTEYIQSAGIPIGVRLATALFYGIQTDSRGMQRSPTRLDREALGFLDKKANRTLLRRIEVSSYSLRQLNYFSIALIKLRFSRNVLYSDIGPVPSYDVCAQVADFLIRVKEANWALVSGVVGKRLVIVFRCDGHKKNAGKTAQAAFGELGSAGGHTIMGRAEIDESALPDGILLTENEKVERFVLSRLAQHERAFGPLLYAFESEGG